MRIGTALTLLALAGALAGRPVLAQDQDQQPGAPVRLVPAAPAAAPAIPAEPKAPAGIGAATLGQLDPSWSTASPQGEPALPPDLWQGTSRAVVRALLPLLGPTESPVLRALARKLLLSGGAAPQGADPSGQPSLVLLRAEAAARLGAIAGAKAALDNFPADQLDETADRLRIELAFAGNDIADGCRRVAAGLTQHRNVWWDQANIACQLLSGDRDKAALSLDILHDRDAAPDPLFDMLVAAASGRPAKLDKHAVLTPLRATLWAVGKRPLPVELVVAMDAPTAAAFAGSDAPESSRLAAAERAAALGAWPVDRLAGLYGKVKYNDAEQEKALSDDRFGDTAAERAVLYNIAKHDAEPAHRSAALTRLLGAANRQGLYFVAARLAAPIVATLVPNDAAKGMAPDLVRASIAGGRVADIAPWLSLADPQTVAPLATLVRAIDGVRPDDKAFAEALAALTLRANDAAPRQLGLFLTLASDYGVTPSAAQLAGQMAPARPGVLPSAAVWLDLQQAAAAHRLGETVLAALVVAEDGNRLATEPIRLRQSLAALRDVGLDAEARGIAREATVAGGL